MRRQFLVSLGTLAMLFAATFGSWGAEQEAVEIVVDGEPAEVKVVEGVVVLNAETGFWIGIALEGEEPPLRIAEVFPGSPAAKAGLQLDDVVLAIGKTEVKNLADVQQSIRESKGKALQFKVKRGEKVQMLEVKPEKPGALGGLFFGTREKEEAEAREQKGDADAREQKAKIEARNAEHQKRTQELNDRLHAYYDQLKNVPQAGKTSTPGQWEQFLQWRQFHLPPQAVPAGPIPADLEVTIKRKGNGPAKIKVHHDVVTWEVNENELHKLPEPIRDHVARMLPGHATAEKVRPAWQVFPEPVPSVKLGEGAPPKIVKPLPLPPELGELLEQLKKQVHELREEVTALRKEK